MSQAVADYCIQESVEFSDSHSHHQGDYDLSSGEERVDLKCAQNGGIGEHNVTAKHPT